MAFSAPQRLRELVGRDEPLVLPGAANALTARLVQEAGFGAVYLSGAGVSNSFLGMADLGLLTVTELVEHVAAVCSCIDIPVVVDADTGFGGSLNVARTVRQLERAGAAAIQIEDQVMPKKCGHFEDKSVVRPDEMVARIYAALDAREDENVMLIARTDSRGVLGFDDAIERGCLYVEAGADMTFVEAPQTVEEVAAVPGLVPGPQILNVVEGGKTPLPSLDEVRTAGYAAVLYANSALRAAIRSMQRLLEVLHEDGSTANAIELMATWDERQALVGHARLEEQADRYRSGALDLQSGALVDELALTDGPADRNYGSRAGVPSEDGYRQ